MLGAFTTLLFRELIFSFSLRCEIEQYGTLSYDETRYPLFCIKSKHWDNNKPTVLITGGVHGYETSGVHGAIKFMDTQAENHQHHFNFIATPCVSPWGYETINRWNPNAADPNRSFYKNSPVEESANLMKLVATLGDVLVHFYLHETTDTDETEFRPTLSAGMGGRAHVTDVTNASRTMIFDINRLEWDDKLLQALDIPRQMLPEVKSCSEVYGRTTIGGTRIPIADIAGEQQAALFGQMCHEKGMAKNTYGTGCFLLMTPVKSEHGLLTTVACKLNGKVTYALEGSVFMAGASVQWLRDELGLVRDADDTGYFASKVDDTGGVYVVPAFIGLGAPYWDPYARGTIMGLTRGTNRNHIVRATLEAIAYQSRDVLEAMQQDSGIELAQLRVDGGAANNAFLMQFQADMLNTPVICPEVTETTAAGAAYLVGLAVGFWSNIDELKQRVSVDRKYTPTMDEEKRSTLYKGWKKAVSRSQHWID